MWLPDGVKSLRICIIVSTAWTRDGIVGAMHSIARQKFETLYSVLPTPPRTTHWAVDCMVRRWVMEVARYIHCVLTAACLSNCTRRPCTRTQLTAHCQLAMKTNLSNARQSHSHMAPPCMHPGIHRTLSLPSCLYTRWDRKSETKKFIIYSTCLCVSLKSIERNPVI